MLSRRTAASTLPGTSAAQRRTIAVLSTAQIVGAVGVGASVSVGALLALDLSGSPAWSGMAATLTTLGAAAAAIPLARLAQARGRRVALSTGWTVAAAGAVLAVAAAVVVSFPVFMVALLLMGAGNAANLQSRFAATDLAPARSRGRALGLVVWATTIGAVAGPNLTRPGAAVADALSIPRLAGPFVFSVVAGAVAAAVLTVGLRPDPLLLARRLDTAERERPAGAPPAPASAGKALTVIAASPKALIAVVTLVTSHAVMVAVMAMTPVHMNGHGASLAVIGLTISLHIAGMFALAPAAGWIADTWGRTPAILTGQALLFTATAVTATAGASPTRVTIGLVTLGLGWSFSTVAASTQLAESIPTLDRPKVQGTADLLMNLAGATAGALSGVLVALMGYTGLSLTAMALVVPAAAAVIVARRSPLLPPP